MGLNQSGATAPLGVTARPKAAAEYLALPGVVYGGAVQTSAVAADQIWYFPIYLLGGGTLTGLYSEITGAAAAGKLFRMGLYTADQDWQPVALKYGSAALAADATGVQSVTALSVALTAGPHLLAVRSNDAPTFRSISGLPPGGGGYDPALGGGPFVYFMRRAFEAFAAFPSVPNHWDEPGFSSIPFRYFVWMKFTPTPT